MPEIIKNDEDKTLYQNISEYAVNLGMQGYTCSESVAMAFASQIGIPAETASRIACGFAGGMAQGKICGAVSGAIMAIGMKYGSRIRKDQYKKDLCFQITQEFSHRFITLRKSLDCAEILLMNNINPKNTEEMKRLREKRLCENIIFDAAKILEELVLESEMSL